MNRRIISKGILVLMGIAMIFSLFGCSGTKKNSAVEFLEYRVSGYNPGYDIKIENGKLIFDNFDEGEKTKRKADEKTISELLSLLERLDIYSWDGYKEYDEDVLDGMGFSLYVRLADGKSINASGSNKFPKNFREFDEAIRAIAEGKYEAKNEEPISGGVTDNTDYNAPKVIESDNLVSLLVGFYHDFKFDRGHGMYYTFYLEPDENGKLILKDNSVDEGFEVDKSVLKGAQEIIRKNNLAAVNGIHKTTAGLPPEYQPCFIEAKYDSGEYISYTANSDPTSEWGEDFVDYFGQIVADNGDDRYLTAKLSGTIKRFSLDIKSGDLLYSYDKINVPVSGTPSGIKEIIEGTDTNEYEVKLNRLIYDLAKEEILDDTIAEPSPEYYEGLMQIISENEIRDFDNNCTSSDLVDSDNPTDYFDFYIEFESGDRMSGAGADPEVLEAFEPLKEQLVTFMDEYIDSHKN